MTGATVCEAGVVSDVCGDEPPVLSGAIGTGITCPSTTYTPFVPGLNEVAPDSRLE